MFLFDYFLLMVVANIKYDLLQDGKVSQLEHVFIRGSKVRYVHPYTVSTALFVSCMLKYCVSALDLL